MKPKKVSKNVTSVPDYISDMPTSIPREKIVEVIREVIKFVPQQVIVEKPRLEGFELYAKLRDIGFYQGGMGKMMENPNGIDKVYIPEYSEVLSSFSLDPDKWEIVRDALCRVWIEINEI